MNRYALRNATLYLAAVVLVVAIAILVPVGRLASPSAARFGPAVGAALARGFPAAVRAGPAVTVAAAYSPLAMPPLSADLAPNEFTSRSSATLLGRSRGALPLFARSRGRAPDLSEPGPPVLSMVAAPVGRFRPPVAPPLRVTRRFDGPPRPWRPGHRGVDLASVPGATVWAAGSGEVVFAGTVINRQVVSIEHAGGLRTTYEPLIPAVRKGDHVAAGDPIGMVAPGHAGCPAPACLHWGLRRDGEYLDPMLLLGFRVRLLPI
ncbi:Murein DD-endopeptidase MepM and murein hydrolase activator NlpD, contain LysM domain [Asanoa hainanensis]|uniref:Murein DD-endopeptidase MepM and murein hydrolase activator NlpD, contain LysM domain n=1 Tax=Asanoa hainanensis TaxID=560556 RepID=A0A239PE81_9ACTN|nr:M23 family metallopeptidase [Asanoa hainanensis]SNT64709.1 Murein DD-endopeptidase MepM and murein hydrolase activator NlpD, contain LysM domain [Asanoa hainanensis]